MNAARADYKDVARSRQIEATLPKAVLKLINDEEDLLLELVADQVENLCGFRPDLDTVSAFLKSNVTIRPSTQLSLPSLSSPPQPSRPLTAHPLATQRIGFSLMGTWYPARNARDVLMQVFLKLAERDQTFQNALPVCPSMDVHVVIWLENRKNFIPIGQIWLKITLLNLRTDGGLG